MKKIDFKKLTPHITAIVLFFAISLTYFSPVLEGYKLRQGDVEKHKAMSHEMESYGEKYDTPVLWTGSMFAGMPTFMISKVKYDLNINRVLFTLVKGGLPHPASVVFAYLIGFYILLMCLRINPWLSIVGAFAFAFSSYFFIIIEAGHNSKALAIAFMAPILGGFIQTLRGNWTIGVLLLTVFISLQLYINHLQITYYLIMVLVFVGVAELIDFAKRKELKLFFTRIAFVILAAVLGALPNLGHLITSIDYSKQSTRGKTELTITPSGKSNQSNVSSGLDKDYITQWSYGIDETFTLIIPNAKGGSSSPILGKQDEVERIKKEDPQFFNLLVSEYQNNQNLISAYFGNQPIVSGPVYAGILIVFLAILAIVFVKNRLVIPLVLVTVLTIMLAWGKNFMGLTELFIDYLPGYNKFRAVAMILLVAEFTMPILAILFLNKLIKERDFIKQQQKKLLITSAVFVAFIGLIVLSPSIFIDLSSESEQLKLSSQLTAGNAGAAMQVQDKVTEYRSEVVSSSAMRSLFIVLLGFLAIWLYLKDKINKQLLIGVIGVIVLIDLWSVNKEYVNNEKVPGGSGANKYVAWVKPQKIEVPYEPSVVDQQIFNSEVAVNKQIQENINQRMAELQRTSRGRVDQTKLIDVTYAELMEGSHYRVLNTMSRLDQDVKTPYFHKSLGGYHGAKMKKYQELVDFYLAVEHYQLRQGFAQGGLQTVQSMLPSMKVSNMLNAKYIIGPDNTGKASEAVILNPYAMGHAWFVKNINVVANADSAMLALRKVNLRETVVIEDNDAGQIEQKSFNPTISDKIQLTAYSPNKLTYNYTTSSNQFAVFSEIYYQPGWEVYINGEESNFLKVNYTIRGMEVPQGTGIIEFVFEPVTIDVGEKLTWASSAIVLLLLIGVIYKGLKED